MKYYLSGAISGWPDFKNYFKKHEDELRELGVSDIFNPAAVQWPEDVRWEVCMKYDLKILIDCDALILLPNWNSSRGVQIEKQLAHDLGIKVVHFKDYINSLIHEGIKSNAS